MTTNWPQHDRKMIAKMNRARDEVCRSVHLHGCAGGALSEADAKKAAKKSLPASHSPADVLAPTRPTRPTRHARALDASRARARRPAAKKAKKAKKEVLAIEAAPAPEGVRRSTRVRKAVKR